MNELRIKLLEIIDNFKFVGDSEADILDAVVCVLESKKHKNEWISVDDELPEKGDYYLVSDGEVVFQLGYSIAGLWTSDDGNPEPISGITHWQPLPPPPQQPTGKG